MQHTSTHTEIDKLKINPSYLGETYTVKTKPANQHEGYEIPEDEDHLYHVGLMTSRQVPGAKRFEDTWNYQSFTPQDWKSMNDSNFVSQYDKVEVLHDPMLNAKLKKDKAGSKGTTPPINPGHQNAPVDPNVNKGVDTNDTQPPIKPPVTDPPPPVKTYVSLPAARNKYKELYGIDADETATIDDLNGLIANAPHKD